MTRNLITFSAAASAALLTLSACSQEQPEAAAEAQNQAAERTAPVAELPPSIQASRTFRCGDDVYYVDFLTNNTAQLRTERSGMATVLTAEGGNPPFVAEGYSIAANDAETRITVPGKPDRTCRSRG